MPKDDIQERTTDPLLGYGRLMSLADVEEALSFTRRLALHVMEQVGRVYVSTGDGSCLPRVFKEDLRTWCRREGIA